MAIEFRHTNWYNDKAIAEDLYQLLEANNISNVIVDTAGRRDLMHMRLTNNNAFIRYVGANHQSDYNRLDDWIERIAIWKEQGVGEVDFFVHQNIEKASSLLSTNFFKNANRKLSTNLTVPRMEKDTDDYFS